MAEHFKTVDPRLGDVISELCDEFGVADDALGQGLSRISGYPKYPRETAVRTSAFKDQLSELTVGTYIFIDHPAEPSAELDATGHEGYRDVAADRVSCLETLISADLQSSVEDLGITLISYKDL